MTLRGAKPKTPRKRATDVAKVACARHHPGVRGDFEHFRENLPLPPYLEVVCLILSQVPSSVHIIRLRCLIENLSQTQAANKT